MGANLVSLGTACCSPMYGGVVSSLCNFLESLVQSFILALMVSLALSFVVVGIPCFLVGHPAGI